MYPPSIITLVCASGHWCVSPCVHEQICMHAHAHLRSSNNTLERLPRTHPHAHTIAAQAVKHTHTHAITHTEHMHCGSLQCRRNGNALISVRFVRCARSVVPSFSADAAVAIDSRQRSCGGQVEEFVTKALARDEFKVPHAMLRFVGWQPLLF